MPVLVIFAPTACGKTSLALSLFGKHADSPLAGRAEVVSADSMQVYKGMDIGTAKPDAALRAELPHHLLDVYEPSEPFSAGDFVRCADEACRDIFRRGKLPLVMGGTGFYIRNFLCGLPPTPESDGTLRSALQARLRAEGASALYAELQAADPVSAARIHPNDEYRIVRALEVCAASGKPLSSFPVTAETRSGFRFCTIILQRDRQELYGRIDARVDEMFTAGLVQEVERLIRGGVRSDDPGMQAIGYREFLFPEIRAIPSEAERTAALKELIRRDSRRYAKRQYTFCRGIPGAEYVHADDAARITEKILSFYVASGLDVN